MTKLYSPADFLPPHLLERTRWLQQDRDSFTAPDLVLYWMRAALRTDENPALDVARLAAEQLGLPLLVYQGLSQNYRYASDRHHAFILQASRDVQAGCAERGISYAFHLERPGQDEPYLRRLADRSAVVITEDMPTDPPQKFLKALCRGTQTPLMAVDTCCIVPMNLVGRAYDRAFAYRNKTKRLYAERATREWPVLDAEARPFDTRQLPFEPVDLKGARIADLVASCEIDHSVGPVVDTQGGTSAGYRRWNNFLEQGIKSYAKRRNNALLDGVSRMSAYLHYGMVSPMRLAREAAACEHAGSEKYLDELLIWRELAHCFCRFRADHSRWSALPEWARQTLRLHSSDERPELYSWEQLARGETGDEFWNAAQKSLLLHGELHNNVRMTWGKAILNWRKSPREALRTMIDLNHRYALDGRDPSSYGGILWCLGQFDRPFTPEQPIFGTVRTRPTAYHAQRLSTAKYAERTSKSRVRPIPQIAVVGAGISGAIAARTLADHGLPVTIFEKSRGAGGRAATRSTEFGNYDHGAQYFTARDERFRRYVRSWVEQGLAAAWDQAVVHFDRQGECQEKTSSTRRYVGVPGMNAIGQHLVRTAISTGQAELRAQTEVARVRRGCNGWHIIDSSGDDLGCFERVIVSPPAPQTASILSEIPGLAGPISEIPMDPCWAVMAALERRLPCDWSGAFINVGALRWVARNSTKPGRNAKSELLTLHANSEWSKDNLEENAESVAVRLLDEFWRVTGMTPMPVMHLQAHRWRYSAPQEVDSQRCLTNEDETLIACGDWAGGPRVEGAFLSGSAAAGRVLGSLTSDNQPAGQLRLDFQDAPL